MVQPHAEPVRDVRVSLPAQEAFARAEDWFNQEGSGPRAWSRWIALRDAPDVLADFLYQGAPSQEHPEYRQLVVSGHRILYIVDPDTGRTETAGDVTILAVFGPGAP